MRKWRPLGVALELHGVEESEHRWLNKCCLGMATNSCIRMMQVFRQIWGYSITCDTFSSIDYGCWKM